MKLNILKYAIDAILFVIVCSTGIVGILIGYVIANENLPETETFFLGLHRNDWGAIHMFLSTVLLILIVLHLLMNIGWIIKTTKQYFGTFWLKFLGMLTCGWIVVLLISWFAVKY